jgi:tripartite-type tricarboxylate transporter receptor subunit TctC
MHQVAAMPEVKEQFATQGLAPTASVSPEEMMRMIRADYATIGKVVKAAGIQPE